jgi:hypothetical protein
MLALIDHGFSENELICLNRVRRHQQVLFFRTYSMQVDGPLIKDTLAGGPRTKRGPHSFSHRNHPHIGTSTCGTRHYAFSHPGATPCTGLGSLLRRATRSGNGDSTRNATNYTRPMDQLWTCIYHLTLMAAQDGPIGGPAHRGMYLVWIGAQCAQ